METKQTLKNCNTQKLFILNELSKTVDLNLFNQIDFNWTFYALVRAAKIQERKQ